MRLVNAAFVFAISASSVLASTVDAHAGTATPPATLGSSSNYVLGNSNCSPIDGLTVTLHVTENISVASSIMNGETIDGTGNAGFSMQLNANGPASGLSTSQLNWQQYVIQVQTDVQAFTQQWANNATDSDPPLAPNPQTMGTPNVLDKNPVTIPAGTTFTWKLTTDSQNNVDSVTYSASDTLGTAYATKTTTFAAADRTPIVAVQLDIVGYSDTGEATFQSGAGTITYTATGPFTAQSSIPSCAAIKVVGANNAYRTGETGTSTYGLMASGSSTSFTQNFFTSTVGDYWNGNYGFPQNSPSALGDWAYGDYKADCPLGSPMYGISRIPGELWSHAVECGSVQYPYDSTGAGCYVRDMEDYDNRGDTDNGRDWDPESYKTECAANEYVAGVSQASGNGVQTSILCCPGAVTHTSCDTQVFYNGDSSGYGGTDWDPDYYKGQCPNGQYVAGVSTPAYTSVGTPGAAHALLCCSE